jgi:hypothetical protein
LIQGARAANSIISMFAPFSLVSLGEQALDVADGERRDTSPTRERRKVEPCVHPAEG